MKSLIQNFPYFSFSLKEKNTFLNNMIKIRKEQDITKLLHLSQATYSVVHVPVTSKLPSKNYNLFLADDEIIIDLF